MYVYVWVCGWGARPEEKEGVRSFDSLKSLCDIILGHASEPCRFRPSFKPQPPLPWPPLGFLLSCLAHVKPQKIEGQKKKKKKAKSDSVAPSLKYFLPLETQSPPQGLVSSKKKEEKQFFHAAKRREESWGEVGRGHLEVSSMLSGGVALAMMGGARGGGGGGGGGGGDGAGGADLDDYICLCFC